MLRTYKAVIQGNQIEWVEEVPNLGNQAVPVLVTVLEEQPVISADSEAWRQSIRTPAENGRNFRKTSRYECPS